MKPYLLILVTAISVIMSSPVNPAGFKGPGVDAPVYSIADVFMAGDDTPCVLEGHIISKIKHRKNRYVFQDKSGEIVVEIKKKVFGELTITPDDLIRIEGEVEESKKYLNEVSVDSIEIIR